MTATATNGNGNGSKSEVEKPEPAEKLVPEMPAEAALGAGLIAFAAKIRAETSNEDELRDTLDALQAVLFEVPETYRREVIEAAVRLAPLVEKVSVKNGRKLNSTARQLVGVVSTKRTAGER